MDPFLFLGDTLAVSYAETVCSGHFSQAANPAFFTDHHLLIAGMSGSKEGFNRIMSTNSYPVSDHCDGHRFFNPGSGRLPRIRDIVRWKISSRAKKWPADAHVHTSTKSAAPSTGIRATWINHSTFLLETPQGNILTDPVYSKRCGPFGRIGPKRAHRPGMALHELPDIHYVLLSHDHYDHCDLPTLRNLVRAHDPAAITPLGNGDLLYRAGFTRIVELDWWQNHSPSPTLDVVVTPAQHWSKRISRPRSHRLWGGFFIRAGNQRLHFVGDSGYNHELFVEIARRLGRPDFAMIPIGAFEPRWIMRYQHCNPSEALQIHRDLGAATSVAMHWGTFQLTDEGRTDPLGELQEALAKVLPERPDFRVLLPGEHIVVGT